MTPNVRRFVEVLSQGVQFQEPIVEIGSYIVKGHEELANLRDFFPGKTYIGCDVRKGPGVDRVENVEKLTFKDKTVGSIIILETLEHVQNFYQAMEEAHRVLKKNGIVVISSLMNFQIHNYPADYWRFTPKGFEQLLRNFPIKIIGYLGEKNNTKHPVNIWGIGFKKNEKKKASNLLNTLRQKSSYVRGRKPKRHKLRDSQDLLKEVVSELNHKYYLKYYIAGSNFIK